MKRVLVGVWLLAAAAGLGISPAAAAPPTAEIQWNELAALIVGHHVSIPLPGGGFVQGEAISVRNESLVLDINKTSEPSRFPKGQTPVPRATVREVRLSERWSAGGRILGTVIGALGGTVAGVELAVHKTNSESAGVSAFTATAVALTVAGYYAGRSADRHTRLLHIAPAGDQR